MMKKWEGIMEFIAVAEEGSFTGAADKLKVSVAQVSRQVKGLEERLAVQLCHRTTRKVSLTEAGQIYYHHCKGITESLDLAELAVTRMQSTPKGKVTITAPVTYGEMKLLPLLNRFLVNYPHIELEINLTNQKLDLIEQGIDFAIRLGHLEDSSLMTRKLSSRQLYVCASPHYLERYGEPHSLSELSHHHCLVGSLDYWRFKENDLPRSLRVRGRLKCNSGFALRDAAKCDLGLTQLPDYYIAQDLERGHLVEVLRQFRTEREGIWVLYPETKNLSPKIRLLIDFLANNLDDQAFAHHFFCEKECSFPPPPSTA